MDYTKTMARRDEKLLSSGFGVVYTHLHACIYAYIPTYLHTWMHACIHIYMHTYTHTNIHACIHTYIFGVVISMLWHRQAILESKRDKRYSSAECRIRTQRVSETQSSADWMSVDKPTELSRIIHTYVRTYVRAIFESKGDNLSFLCRKQDSNLEVSRQLIASRLNGHSQTHWAIEDQA